ncbi:LacI family DNA-binding transcriptional regulator [Arhodomonas sp. AD133]|uniref:LacI family DNA-binding transcriptional regulator n=1 Tax=Arhodomonas sp. AD133 TaxID=3415009 RepID=UPI003EB81CCB
MSREGGRRKTTIYDVAREAGASSATVSMVLNGSWKQYRIKPETAERILDTAVRLDYNVNMLARGLRLSRSGLAGMIIPHYRNRFFASLAETFEAAARRHGLCPIVVSTQRDRDNERGVVEALLSQRVESVFIAGVHRPEPLNDLCRAHRIPCVNLDLPGEHAPSVVSDSRAGARELTEAIITAMRSRGEDAEALCFLGGRAGDYATDERVAGFNEALEGQGIAVDEHRIHCCGYSPDAARREAKRLVQALGRLPPGLFINSITALEGVIGLASELAEPIEDRVILGCFDWDPFAAALPYSILMMRQNVEAMIEEAFVQVARAGEPPYPFIKIPTTFEITSLS